MQTSPKQASRGVAQINRKFVFTSMDMSDSNNDSRLKMENNNLIQKIESNDIHDNYQDVTQTGKNKHP